MRCIQLQIVYSTETQLLYIFYIFTGYSDQCTLNIDHRCFWFVEDSDGETWDDAESECESHNGRLAVLDTQAIWEDVQASAPHLL